jgi:uncharacterized membrane protein
MVARRYILWLWVAIVVQLLGRGLDGWWHATHDEFEGTSQQFEAHWLLWLGVLFTLGVVIAAFVRLPASERNVGWTVLLLGLILYIPVSVWHFIEHANRNDPELAHILLAVGQLAMLVGVVAATLLARRAPPRAEPAPG